MIRYNKSIEVRSKRTGEIELHTDMGQIWRTTIVKEYNQFTSWLQSHHTELRNWQRDMLDLIHQAYNPETGLHSIELYWVYPKGSGYMNQTTDIAFAQIPSKHIWILMTPQNTWIKEDPYGNFFFSVETASGSVINKETRDEIWDFRDYMRHGKKIPVKRSYNDDDYVKKGIAP